MPRKVRDSSLENRTARSRLKVAHKPYFRLIKPGLHLGYRKLASGPGTWIVRRYAGEGRYVVENLRTADGRLIVADDYSDTDGEGVLDFGEAQEKAQERREDGTQDAADVSRLTVHKAVENYIAERDARETRRRGRPFRSDAHRLERYVIGREQRKNRKTIAPATLADKLLEELSKDDLRKWRASLPQTLSATAQRRTISDLKAALAAAYAEDDNRRLKPTFPDIVKQGLKVTGNGHDDESATEVRENQILSEAQRDRLLRAVKDFDAEQEWDGDLYRLVVVLAATGTRFGQVARMRVGDVQRKAGRLMVPTSRKGKGQKIAATPVPVGKDVLEALLPATTGRNSEAPLLERWRHRQVRGNKWERDARGPWQAAAELDRPFRAIRKRARLSDEIVAYSLRHTSIVRGLEQLLPVQLVARLHDTSVAMIEKHYARWIAHGLEDMAAKAVVPLLPQDNFKPENKLATLR
jgi:integrase